MDISWSPVFPIHWYTVHRHGAWAPSQRLANFQLLPCAVNAILWLISFPGIQTAKCERVEWLGFRSQCALTAHSHGGDFYPSASTQILWNIHQGRWNHLSFNLIGPHHKEVYEIQRCSTLGACRRHHNQLWNKQKNSFHLSVVEKTTSS